jgi:hypothetical protein
MVDFLNSGIIDQRLNNARRMRSMYGQKPACVQMKTDAARKQRVERVVRRVD